MCPGRSLRTPDSLRFLPATPVTDPYLYLTGGPNTEHCCGQAPTGDIHILAHHTGALSQDETLTATWTPGKLFGSSHLNLNLDYSIATGDTGGTLANLTLTN
jgi:hypothetical protein